MQQLDFQKKISFLISGYGFILVLFYGSILLSNTLHRDLTLIDGAYNIQHRLSDIALLVHLAVGCCLMLARFQQRLFGVLASVFAFVSLAFVIYFNISEAILGLGSLVFGLIAVSVLLVFPSLYLLFIDIHIIRKIRSFSSYDNVNNVL